MKKVFFYKGGDVCCTRQTLCNGDSREPKTVDLSPLSSTDIDRDVYSWLILLNIDIQLLLFAAIEIWVAFCALLCKIVFPSLNTYCCLGSGRCWWYHQHTSQWSSWIPCRQSWVYNVKRRGLSSQPWGTPVLSTKMEEVWLPIQTV